MVPVEHRLTPVNRRILGLVRATDRNPVMRCRFKEREPRERRGHFATTGLPRAVYIFREVSLDNL
jgi:hypothetical protein